MLTKNNAISIYWLVIHQVESVVHISKKKTKARGLNEVKPRSQNEISVLIFGVASLLFFLSERSPIGPTLEEFDWIEMVLTRLEN